QIMNAESGRDMSLYSKSHSGVLEMNPDGFGFLRTRNYMAGENDIYVSPSQIRKYRLSSGDLVQGRIRISGENERYDALLYVEKINDKIPEVNVNRPDFEKLVAIFPDVKMRLETSQDVISTRILDIFAPIGKGQRGMIVSSPKAGKTILLKQIAKSVRANHPDVKLIILLIDERPEEVTDMQRSIECDVIYSTFDQKPSNHIKAAEIVLERAKRLVESGADVMILVDSITRLARANNLVVPPSGRTLSGGLDPESLYFPKKFFGSARNIENGGSLTIIATALVETGSRMDDMIFEEFKGTGNMEVHLERSIAESRIYPAINIPRSGTRREDLLLTDQVMAAEFGLRKAFSGAGPNAFIDNIIQHLRKTPSNKAFVEYVLKNYLTN
ncbi:MAG: transcription termination factor Rho, partial [Eubacteriaceae bacterium]|nr:transcription termination factor Rho [Eubacteriaceae bacterium]